MRRCALPGGTGATMPALGLGTWHLGESRAGRAADVAAVRSALELGYRLIDTAEMYGDGGAEEVVGQAVAEALRAGDLASRDELVVVSKVYPHNASRSGTRAACDRSRRRLGLDRIDAYLLHWRGPHPLAETVDALQALQQAGAVGRWGVSNLDVDDLDELAAARPDAVGGAHGCATDQVWYSLRQRGPEFALLPWLQARGLPLMAYSPIDQGALAGACGELGRVASELGVAPAQLALAWLLQRPGVVAIPKARSREHLRQNLAAADLTLDDAVLQRLEAAFPPPRRKPPLAML